MKALSWLERYYHWLHGQWPAGVVEKLPQVGEDYTTNLPGVYVVGDLTGIPLLKFATDSGARVVDHIVAGKKFKSRKIDTSVYDLIIVGGGVSGWAAALQAEANGLTFLLLESTEDLSTIKNFPTKKPIFAYPPEMKSRGAIQLGEDQNTKEKLLDDLNSRIRASAVGSRKENVSHVTKVGGHIEVVTDSAIEFRAHNVIVAIGKSGNFRQIGATGEDNPKVVNRLHDPSIYIGKHVAIVGSGDSALEATIAIAKARAERSHELKEAQNLHKGESQNKSSFEQGHPEASLKLIARGVDISNAKQENIDAVLELEKGKEVEVLRETIVESITDDSITVRHSSATNSTFANDAVLSLIGREAPLEFFRRSKMSIQGESTAGGWLYFILFVAFIILLYDWKNYGFLNDLWSQSSFPNEMPGVLLGLSEWSQLQVQDRSTLLGTIAVSMKSRSFYYTVLYTSCIGIFGYLRVRRRKTKYVTVQTWSLFLIQLIPLFLLPEVLLPWLGYMGAFDSGMAKAVADSLFPSYISAAELAAHTWPEWGHPRAYWHAYGLILAWPLSVYNVFTASPMAGWLIISFIQTFVLIPALIYKYGKGAYCGWICSCGALAETMGDSQRHKMPHGAASNEWNLVGQVLLVIAFVLLFVRIGGWIAPESWAGVYFDLLLKGENAQYELVNPLSWKWTVDVLFGGILGVGLYFKYSGRIWCRFACPLAALMNIYARFSRFRIFSQKEKCISCNQCTSVCHQGIDIMSFANKGKPMEDPQCVRCSACVQVCPTGVLSFGEIDKATGKPLKYDKLQASLIPIVNI